MSTIPPSSSDDELVSAVLDGVATAEERARVLADPRLSAQLQALAAVRDAIAAPVTPLPPDVADRLIERALAAAAPTVAPAPPPPPAPTPAVPPPPSSAPPVSLDAARQGRDARRRARWGPALLGVAALLLVGLVAVPLLGSLGDDEGGEQTAAIDASDEQSESAGDASDAGGEALFEAEPSDDDGGPTAAEDSTPGMTTGARPQPSPVDLGSHDDVEALADVAVEAGPVPVDPAAPGCATEPAGDRLVLRGEAEVDGDPVVVEVWWTDGGDDAVVQIVDAATCDLVDELSRPR